MISVLNSSFSRIIANSLSRASQDVGRSLQRLSSGHRLNSAADGIADYNLYTTLGIQARGLQRAILNVNDVKGLTQTADSTLNSVMTIAYQLREIAQRATSESLTSAERDSLQDQATQLLTDYDRYIGDTTYNSRTLFDSTFGTMSVQAGVNASSAFDFSLGDARSITLGRLAVYSGAQGAITAALGSSNSVKLNGTFINASSDDGISTSNASFSSIAIANAINAMSDTTGVSAESLATTRTLYLDAQGTFTQTLSAGEFVINDVSITGSSLTSASTLVTAINGFSSSTGVKASLDGSSNIVLTAVDGRNIELAVSNGATHNFYDWVNLSTNVALFSAGISGSLSAGASQTHVGAVRLWSSSAILIEGTSPSNALGVSSGSKAFTSGIALKYLDMSSSTTADEAVKVLDATIAQISSLKADVGAVHSRLDQSASYLLDQYTATLDAKSSVGDTDFVLETANLVAAQLLQNSSIAALTQANVSRVTVARLLQDL